MATRYAIIADIHGNLHGLEAVLRDARAHGAERWLFLGDYIGDFPFVNECAERVRQMPDAVSIRGNKEDYFGELRAAGDKAQGSLQFAPITHSFRALRPDNLAWLDALPEKRKLEDEQAGPMILAHSVNQLIGNNGFRALSSSMLARRMEKAPFTHAALLTLAQTFTDHDPAVAALPKGAYLFGDSHVQWHARRGDVLLLNPGSCGLPLDGDPSAKYSLLDEQDGAWHVIERQIPYDVEAAADALLSSELNAVSPLWSRFTVRKMRTGVDCLYPLFEELAKHSGKAGSIADPHEDAVWRRACEEVLERL